MTCTPWVTHTDVVPALAGADLDDDLLDETMQMASDLLFNLTGRKYPGVCTDTVRPLASRRVAPGWGRWMPSSGFYGYGAFGSGRDYCACNRSPDFGCGTIPEFPLPGRPVIAEGTTVKVDGVTFTGWRVDDGYRLVRTDGAGWPCCQNLLLADTEPGTWSVTYQYGRMPPIGGVRAAALLGGELYIAIPGAPGVEDRQTNLPKRITSIARQGITLAVIDPLTLFADGNTGLPFVDLWVANERLANSRRPATVHRPGRERTVRRVG
jgi:hypothetical protein